MKFFLFCLTSDDDDYSYSVLLHLITLFNDLVGFMQSTIKPEWHSVQAVRGTTSHAHTLLITNSFSPKTRLDYLVNSPLCYQL